ncbi:MAG TPA: hypothetical protein VLV31_01495 [Candidatus Acidoferrales bacterium]|nr:hypothetical protein [Candidatus Acidoferrales bacterium]
MSKKLLVFSIIQVAPPGYQTPYGVGIVEDENGKRGLVRIKQESLATLKTGMTGRIQQEPGSATGDLNFFYPD